MWNLIFQVNEGVYVYMSSPEYKYTTYTGLIVPDGDDGLKITYTSEKSVILKVDHAGNFSGFPTPYCSRNFTGFTKLHLALL